MRCIRQKPTFLDYSIRKADIDDIESIYEIELDSFINPWSIAGFFNEFEVPFSDIIVAERAKDVIGYAVLWKVRDELHLHKIAVTREYRKLGIARALIDHSVQKYGNSGIRKILLEVREKNIGARAFYKKLGFRENGIRHGYYPDDNAILIEKLL